MAARRKRRSTTRRGMREHGESMRHEMAEERAMKKRGSPKRKRKGGRKR